MYKCENFNGLTDLEAPTNSAYRLSEHARNYLFFFFFFFVSKTNHTNKTTEEKSKVEEMRSTMSRYVILKVHIPKSKARVTVIRKIAVCFLWLSLPGHYRVTDEALLAETT